MKCPYCGSQKSRVLDKRATDNSTATRRRRQCLDCKKRYTTYERTENIELSVIKKSGKTEPFDNIKLERGIMKACEKRPVSLEDIRKIVRDIENHLRNKDTVEIQSYIIGRMVMSRLKKLDKVSYIRFASVYKDFKELEEFREEIKKLA